MEYDIEEAMRGKDIILTDSLGKDMLDDFSSYQINQRLMKMANHNALLNPCPPFYRGEEVSQEAIESDFFVGYQFKKSLLEVE